MSAAPAVHARMSTLDGPGGPLAVYEARPDEPTSGVLLIHEAFGVTDHITDVARRLARLGHYVVAPDFFHRGGTGTVAPYHDIQQAIPFFRSLSGDDDLLADADTALEHLRRQGFADSRIGVLGFCFGGRVSFLVGARRPLGAAVTFYGGGVAEGRVGLPPLVDLAPALRAPWQGHFGDLDTGIPVDQVEALRGAASLAAATTELHRYAEAGHGFNCDDRDAYHEPSATLAWGRTLDWFAQHLAS